MIRQDYTFNPSLRTVTFTNTVLQNKIGIITNVSRGIVIYNGADSSALGTLSGKVLTLAYNTSAMNSSDVLQVFYAGEEDGATYTAQESQRQVQESQLSVQQDQLEAQQNQLSTQSEIKTKLDSIGTVQEDILDVQNQLLTAQSAIHTSQDLLVAGQTAALTEVQAKTSLLERLMRNVISRLTFSTTGMRVDCGGSSVIASLASAQTLATVTQANAVLGRATLDGQGIQIAYMSFQQGFRRNITIS